MSNRAKKIKFGYVYIVVKDVAKSKKSFLEEMDKFVDWKQIKELLDKYIKRNKNVVGKPA